MATPLKLRSERVGKITLAEQSPFLSVLVDTGVFHLDQSFDYSLPAKFEIQVGQWVSVPFHGRNCQGLVIDRKNGAISGKVHPINRPIKGPFISKEHLKLYKAVAERWASPIFDVLRFAVKSPMPRELPVTAGLSKRTYLQLKPERDEISQLIEIGEKLARSGATLVIVPEARTAAQLSNFSFDIGMRGAILTPNRYSNIIILREESEHHFEIKRPGFNTRDVALLRNEFLTENLLFVGFTPSLEMVRLIESGFVSLKRTTGATQILVKPVQQGELIPSAMIKPFKSALARGPILVIAPSKGYGLAISCASCRNLAKCDCGGKLTKRSRSDSPHCVICNKVFQNWRCTYCRKDRIYLLGRGIERIAEEFGKSFPNTAIHIATSDKNLEGEIPKRSIVLATVGAAPANKEIVYSATLFLDGLNLASDMRSEERYLSTLFRYTALASGRAFVVDRTESPSVNSLIKWQPFILMRRFYEELKSADLPPSTRHLILQSEESEAARIYTGIQSAIREGRLPNDLRIHNIGNGAISIFFSLRSAKKMTQFIFEFQKRRSISGKALLKVRIDPYLLG